MSRRRGQGWEQGVVWHSGSRKDSDDCPRQTVARGGSSGRTATERRGGCRRRGSRGIRLGMDLSPPIDPRTLKVHRVPLRDVPYVPTDDAVVAAMLRFAGVTEKDVVYDLGCGDGRIVIQAARLCG